MPVPEMEGISQSKWDSLTSYSEEFFRAVQHILKSKKRQRHSARSLIYEKLLLKGFLYCPICPKGLPADVQNEIVNDIAIIIVLLGVLTCISANKINYLLIVRLRNISYIPLQADSQNHTS